jgi:hypothetical protein
MTLYTITFWLLLLLCPLILYFTAPVLLKEGKMSKRKKLYLGLHAFFLSIITIVIFNQPDSITTNQDEIVNLLKHTAAGERYKADQYLRDNFILINNSHDQSFIKYNGQDSGPTSVQAITNRKHLTSFINWCIVNEAAIDLVVCDIGFTVPDNDADKELRASLKRLAGLHKLLLSQSDVPNPIIDSISEDSKGMVNERTAEDRFNTHQIFRNGHYSLAYKLYSRLDTVTPYGGNSLLLYEKKPGYINPLRMTIFLPFLYMTQSNFHLLSENPGSKELTHNFPGFSIGNTRIFHNLEKLVDDTIEKKGLYNDLHLRKSIKLKNVLFIGVFEGDADVHHTFFGELRGSVILLNLVYNLHIGNNSISLLLFLELFMGFWLITYLLIYGVQRSISENWVSKMTPAFVNRWLRRKQRENKHVISLTVEILKEHIYWVALAIVVFLIYFSTGVLVNIAGLLFYFLIFRVFLLTFGKNEQGISKVRKQQTHH